MTALTYNGGDFIATTTLIPLHVGKGKTIASALGRSVDYVENPSKTNDGELISSYECDPLIAEQQFLFTKSQYASLTGRKQGDRDVIAYHLRQSFKPDEIDPQTANKIGYDLAMSLTKGKHAFLVCTHVDKKHIHSHIIFNSTTLDCKKKFRNFWNSSFAIRKISDLLCLENSLSVIENPNKSKGHYGKWMGDDKPLNQREQLKKDIDDILAEKPSSFSDFLSKMRDKGYAVKYGKHLGFVGKGKEKCIRLRSLKEGYLEADIRAVIEGKAEHKPTKLRQPKIDKKMNLVIDLERALVEKGKGYEQWAKTYNLKQMAKTMLYLRENNLVNYEDLKAKSDAVSNEFHTLSKDIKATEKRLNEVVQLQKYIYQFARTKPTYDRYKKSGYSAKFKEENITEILLHQASKKYFKELGLEKLPKMADLKLEREALSLKKKTLYSNYHNMKKEMQELAIAKQNIEQVLELDKPKKEKQKSSPQR